MCACAHAFIHAGFLPASWSRIVYYSTSVALCCQAVAPGLQGFLPVAWTNASSAFAPDSPNLVSLDMRYDKGRRVALLACARRFARGSLQSTAIRYLALVVDIPYPGFCLQEPFLHVRQAHHRVDRGTPACEQHRGVIPRQLLRRLMRQRYLTTTASEPLAPALAFTLAPVPSLAVALAAAVVSAPTCPCQRLVAPAAFSLVFSPCQHHTSATATLSAAAISFTAAAIP